MTDSTEYHDYVFRDGKLIGQFEQMYRNSATIPWHQDEQSDWIDVRLTRDLLRDFGRFNSVHDLGCGTGHYLALISSEFLLPGGKAYGYDVSATACEMAAEYFPGGRYTELDLTVALPTRADFPGNRRVGGTSLFMIRGTLWYVFPRLSTVIDNIARMMNGNDRLLIVQNFPPLDTQFVGKEVIPDFRAIIAHFSDQFALDRYAWYEDRSRSVNDNWFVGIFSPRI